MNDSTPIPAFQQCRVCGISLPLTTEYFYRKPGNKYGYNRRCISCMRGIYAGTVVVEKPVIPDGHKQCSKCSRILSHSEFFRDPKHPSGFTCWCKDCAAEKRGAVRKPVLPPVPEGYKRRAKLEACLNPLGNVLPSTTEYFFFNKSSRDNLHSYCKVCNMARNNEYRKEHADELRVKARKYLSRVREVKSETSRQWRQRNKEKVLFNNHRRKLRKLELPCDFTPDDWRFAVNYFGGCCAACGRPAGLWHKIVMDHWIPLASPDCPGTVPKNIIPLCHGVDGCNNGKRDMSPDKWLIWRFGKRKAKQITERINDYLRIVSERL